jgi:hypothetical protein
MTDCNREPLPFSSLGAKSVVADFLGGRLTTGAGALLLREVGEKTGLFDALNEAIPDPRNPVFIIAPDRVAQYGSGASSGRNDPVEAIQSSGSGAGKRPPGHVPSGDELSVSSPVPCNPQAGLGHPHAGEGRSGLSQPKSQQ